MIWGLIKRKRQILILIQMFSNTKCILHTLPYSSFLFCFCQTMVTIETDYFTLSYHQTKSLFWNKLFLNSNYPVLNHIFKRKITIFWKDDENLYFISIIILFYTYNSYHINIFNEIQEIPNNWKQSDSKWTRL